MKHGSPRGLWVALDVYMDSGNSSAALRHYVQRKLQAFIQKCEYATGDILTCQRACGADHLTQRHVCKVRQNLTAFEYNSSQRLGDVLEMLKACCRRRSVCKRRYSLLATSTVDVCGSVDLDLDRQKA